MFFYERTCMPSHCRDTLFRSVCRFHFYSVEFPPTPDRGTKIAFMTIMKTTRCRFILPSVLLVFVILSMDLSVRSLHTVPSSLQTSLCSRLLWLRWLILL
ncbi:transmembrane protein, putative [Bodo saltans]|uniref:Transmembrane protein, putative n=1 Tax=Bodo saltans TaxID=75058 RepID=A0A0S4JBX5_BODSA|nr:transmembrane protein, putative [Bodo saltans]|eukprot:CUG87492.1 transmembrane protein, putative [Bodo saltans]